MELEYPSSLILLISAVTDQSYFLGTVPTYTHVSFLLDFFAGGLEDAIFTERHADSDLIEDISIVEAF